MLRILPLIKISTVCILVTACNHEKYPKASYDPLLYNPGDLYSDKEVNKSNVVKEFSAGLTKIRTQIALGIAINSISGEFPDDYGLCLDLANGNSSIKQHNDIYECFIRDKATEDLFIYSYSSKETYNRDKSRGVLSRDGVPYANLPQNWKTYSMSLVCNPEWIMKLDSDPDALSAYYHQYKAFGKAIGSEHLAVWFWEVPLKALKNSQLRKKEPTVNKESSIDKKMIDTFKKYDVSRAIGYCIKYKLKPSRSPYVLLTTSYPNSEDPPENYFVVELGSLSEQGSIQMLSALADQIVTKNLNQDELNSRKYWTSWKTVIDTALASLGNLSERINILIDTKFFKLEFGKSDKSEKAQSAPSSK